MTTEPETALDVVRRHQALGIRARAGVHTRTPDLNDLLTELHAAVLRDDARAKEQPSVGMTRERLDALVKVINTTALHEELRHLCSFHNGRVDSTKVMTAGQEMHEWRDRLYKAFGFER